MTNLTTLPGMDAPKPPPSELASPARKLRRKAGRAPAQPDQSDQGRRGHRRRTGAGSLVNPDNIVVYWIAVGLLGAGSLAPLVASVDGLLHVAAWYMRPELQWTLPFAFDVLMVGSAITALALRRRHARWESMLTTALTLVLVAGSSWANWLEVSVKVDVATVEGQASMWIKAAMPMLTFFGFEIIAMLTSTRKQGENAPLRVAQAKVKRLQRELRADAKAARREVRARRRDAHRLERGERALA